jgi:hypothetical protein
MWHSDSSFKRIQARRRCYQAASAASGWQYRVCQHAGSYADLARKTAALKVWWRSMALPTHAGLLTLPDW